MSKNVRTIYDLAELAGVSAATVSRALAGSTLVGAKTAERVQELARKHNFRPSSFARNLRIRRRGAVGVVIPLGHDRAQHISDPFFMTMIGCLADELTERGFDLVLSRVIPDQENWLDAMIDADRADGIIVIGQSNQSATLDRVARWYPPMVVWGGYCQGQTHCSVGSDNFLGGRMATEHLLSRGCRRIAFCGNLEALEIRQRHEGACAAVAECADANLLTVPTHLASELSTAEIAAAFDNLSPLPDGVFAASDMIALSSIQVLAGRGMRVPDTVKVVGYDDLPLARSSLPALTTIRQDVAQGASQLVESLLKRIDGRQTGSVILNPELIVRCST